jgi:hypothetical protein
MEEDYQEQAALQLWIYLPLTHANPLASVFEPFSHLAGCKVIPFHNPLGHLCCDTYAP